MSIMDNFYFYRLPGKDITSAIGGAASVTSDNTTHDGFIISPFLPGSKLMLIPAENPLTLDDIDRLALPEYEPTLFSLPSSSTPKERYMAGVTRIISEELSGNLDKAVAARCIALKGKVRLKDSFVSLCQLNPEAFVFIFYTPGSGLWMGASPECLIEKKGHMITSDVLAGTKQDISEEWDSKNLTEHEVVRQYIMDMYDGFGLNPQRSETSTVRAGNVWHLKSKVNAIIDNTDTALLLAKALSPTPALCGTPKDEALLAILTSEDFQRGYYGGFCGPLRHDDFALYVNLRSGCFLKDRIVIYAGGGIMKDSIPEKEWEETINKSHTILDGLIMDHQENDSKINQIIT